MNDHEDLSRRAQDHLATLCAAPDRRPGGAANDSAVDHVAEALRSAGWEVETPDFACLNWETDGARLQIGEKSVALTPAPYGTGGSLTAPIRVVRTLDELGRSDLGDCIVVLDGDLASEPLTPKNYPFYGSAEHAEIVSALEDAGPAAVIGVTGKHAPLCGAIEPFPLIEDGDFDIPAAMVHLTDAEPVLGADGRVATITIGSERITTQARNVVANLGATPAQISLWAHIDTKPDTPGAIDNGASVVALLALAELLGDRPLEIGIELVVVNGEDHFAAPGEQHWLGTNGDRFDEIALMVNLDAIGCLRGATTYSLYNVDQVSTDRVHETLAKHPDIVEGPAWFQSDHAIFAARGRPALAFTSERFDEMLETLIHSTEDTPDQVDLDRVVDVAAALAELVRTWA